MNTVTKTVHLIYLWILKPICRGIKRLLPQSVVYKLYAMRLQRIPTKFLGPRHKPNHQCIQIDITYECNLHCVQCDRSCAQARTTDHMSLKQIEKFIIESKEDNRRWECIDVLGGEPTLHPQFHEIISMLLSYIKHDSPNTRLVVITNGFGKGNQAALEKLPTTVKIANTQKTSPIQNHFFLFNLAPIDDKVYKNTDYNNKCFITSNCGIALTKNGYYLTAVGGGIDRVFGFNIGRKKLPPMGDPLTDQALALCKYCGHFKMNVVRKTWLEKSNEEGTVSKAWSDAYRRYRENKPFLSEY